MSEQAQETQEPQTKQEITSIFEEVETMTDGHAINVLVQVAGLAQESGKLNIRDSVLLAKAISILSPGTI
mgnify:CR=1 FL=1